MKKIFIFLLFFIFVIFQNLYPKTLVVDDDYNLLTHNTCEGICIPFIDYCYNNIQDAVDNAGNNDTIKICKGTYNEEVRINKNINKLTITNGQDAHIPDDIKINSNNTGIFIGYGWKNVRNLSINNISITSKDAAIYFLQGRNITLNNINIVSSNNYGFFSSYDAEGNFNFKDIVIKSKKSGIYINDGKKLSFDTITIKVDSSNQYGIFTNWDVTNNNSSFKNINIKFINGAGIIIRECKNTNFDNISITNTGSNSNSHGILIDWDASGTNYFKNLSINVSGIGLNIRSGRPHIENSEIISKKNTAVFFNWDTSNVSITNSKLISNSSSASNYALLIQNSNNNAIINNNCFYHTDFAPYKLAKADEAGNNFDGNFWEGHSGGVYQDGNVVDHSPLSSCPFGGGGGGNLIVDYHMDECFWNGTSGEVKDNSSNGYNATAQNSANTVSNGKICRAGDFTNTNYIKPVTNIPLSTNYTITLWVKFPLNSQGHSTFIEPGGKRYQYFNIADRPSTNDDFLYLKKNVNNGQWLWCVDGDIGYPTCNNFIMNYTGWHFLTFLANDNNVKLYIDGNYIDIINKKPSGSLNLIGASDYQNDYNGQTIGSIIDEFKIFNKALTLSQIQQIYDNENSEKNWDGSERTCPLCFPVADYHFDECGWSGASGEVTDSTPHHYNGTAKNGANTVDNDSVEGIICRVGYFDGNDDYIEIPSDVTDVLKGTASLSFWIKTSQTGNNIDWRAPGVIGVEQDGGVDDIFWGWLDASGHIGISKGDNFNNSKSNTPINDNKWHHVVLTRNAANGHVRIYIDGSLDKIGSTDSGVVGTSFLSIGRIENTNPSKPAKYFHGYIDEIKIFNYILNSNTVQQIYNNEKNRKNWNGTERECENCGITEVNHYEIIHDGNGLTCEPEDITIKACGNDNCSVLYTDNVTLTLTPTGWIGGDTHIFSGGEASLQLSHTTQGTVTLGISSSNPDADYCCRNLNLDNECVNDSLHCNITFYDSGFIFNVPNQTSCKDSDNITIKAVGKDPDTSKCVAKFTNVDKNLKFWFNYDTPSSNPYGNKLYLKGNNDSDFIELSTSEPSNPNISIHFNSNGEGNFQVRYNDAGRLNLHAKYQEGTLVMLGDDVYGGSGNGFVFKPWAYYIDIPGNPAATSSNDAVFKKAGEDFVMTIKAVCWENGDNISNNNDLSNNLKTSNFYGNINISHSLILPQPGNPGNLKVTNSVISNGELTIDNQSYSEVGIISINVNTSNYLNAGGINGTVNYVGRFIPHHFYIANKINGVLFEKCSGLFNYSGLTTQYSTIPKFTIIAQNIDNITTQNYKNNFFKLTLSSFNISTPTTDDEQLGKDGLHKININIENASDILSDQNNGTAVYSFNNDNVTYLKENNSKIAPFSPKFSFVINNIVDSDGVTCINLPDNISVTGNLLKFGHLNVIDNYGPETDNLTINIYTEYWNGQKWMVNGDDSCTSLSASDFKLDNYTGNLNPGETSINNVNGIDNGKGSLILTAPGDNNSGSVTIYLDPNSIFYPYLNDNETPGIATFGIYRGRDRIILWQEIPSNSEE